MDKSKLEEYDAIIRSLPDRVFVLTESGRYAAILGGESQEQYHDGSFLKDLCLYDVLPYRKATWFINRIKETLSANKLMIYEYSLAADDVVSIDHESGPSGQLRFEGRVSPLKSLRYGERAVVWVARNITERYELEQQLTYKAEIDHLSNSFNRRKLFECLNDAFYKFRRYNEATSFMLLDIDDFKKINDTFGHHVGDEVIRNLSRLCQSVIRHTDVFGRIGGDEFGIIYRSPTKATLSFANRLKKIISSHSVEQEITISIGISQFNKDDDNVEQVYKRADLALYQAKQSGKNKCSVI